MPLPYFLSTLIYVLVALLSAADAALVSLNLLPEFMSLHWERVHFITLGIATQAIFGLLPVLAAWMAKRPKPRMRWDIWLSLNAGIIAMAAGFSGMIPAIIFTGGTLVFIATILLLVHAWQARGSEAPDSLKFYITGVFFLLVGIIIGTGLFLNWSPALYIQVPLEAHIHANSWGFMSLVFAGLLMDVTRMVTGRRAGEPQATSLIFLGMTLGATALVLAPWLGGNEPLMIGGIVLHLAATIWLLLLVIRAFRASEQMNTPGAWHLLASYIWVIAPVLSAPFTIMGVVEAAPIEETAPQALIYGWVLQFAMALIPYIARRFLLNREEARLGGSWASVAAATAGSILVWASIFIEPAREILYALGYGLYAVTLMLLLVQLIGIANQALHKFESAGE